MQDYPTPRSVAFQTKNLKGMIDLQRGLFAAMLMLLLLSIDSVTSRPLLHSTGDWQRSAGTNGIVPYDTLLPCVETAACAGRVFGSHSEDVSKFGNVPPCISYGWVRCIQHPDQLGAIDHSTHGQLAPPAKHYYYAQEKNRPMIETYSPSQGERSAEPARYAAINNQRIEWQNWGLQPNEAERRWERPFADTGSLDIPAEKRTRFNMGVFQFHQTSPPSLVNKQALENVRGNQRNESPGFDGRPTERPVEFHHGQQRFEQSSQLMKPAKFGQQKNEEQHGMRSGQNQLTRTLVGYEFLDNNLAAPQPWRQRNKPEHLPGPFGNEREQKKTETRPFEPHSQSGPRDIADAIQRFVKVEAPKPIEVQSLQTDGRLREESNRLFTELVPVQRKSNEFPQVFDQVNQRLIDQSAEQKPFVKRPDVEQQSLFQATRRPLEFQPPAKPIVQQPMPFENAQQQRPSAKPLHDVKETITVRPRPPQTTARPLAPVEKLEQAAVKSSSLIGSPEFIEPAKSSLENLLIRLNSAKDTQQADEQLTALLRFFAMPANQPASPEERLTDSSDSAPPFMGKHESNVVPFIAFSEPLPLEPTSNALF